jgi:hypothetical protein
MVYSPQLACLLFRAKPSRRSGDYRVCANAPRPLQGALPNREHAPAGSAKRRIDLPVALDIPCDFAFPEVLPCARTPK